MGSAGRSKRTGHGKRRADITKTVRNKRFSARHIDQVWEDVRKEQNAIKSDKYGPLGTTNKVELDEDLPAQGKHYCIPCSKYFVSDVALLSHQREKPHKKRIKELLGARPHNQRDAEWAGGMGPPDNGTGPVTKAMDTR